MPVVRDCGVYRLEYSPLVGVGEELGSGLHHQQIGFSDGSLIESSNVAFVKQHQSFPVAFHCLGAHKFPPFIFHYDFLLGNVA